MFTNKKRCCLFGFNLVIIGVFLFNVSVLIAQVRPAAQRPTGLPLPSRGGAPVPTPSALPSQQLASQAPVPPWENSANPAFYARLEKSGRPI